MWLEVTNLYFLGALGVVVLYSRFSKIICSVLVSWYSKTKVYSWATSNVYAYKFSKVFSCELLLWEIFREYFWANHWVLVQYILVKPRKFPENINNNNFFKLWFLYLPLYNHIYIYTIIHIYICIYIYIYIHIYICIIVYVCMYMYIIVLFMYIYAILKRFTR